jgi:hypothetical protein
MRVLVSLCPAENRHSDSAGLERGLTEKMVRRKVERVVERLEPDPERIDARKP